MANRPQVFVGGTILDPQGNQIQDPRFVAPTPPGPTPEFTAFMQQFAANPSQFATGTQFTSPAALAPAPAALAPGARQVATSGFEDTAQRPAITPTGSPFTGAGWTLVAPSPTGPVAPPAPVIPQVAAVPQQPAVIQAAGAPAVTPQAQPAPQPTATAPTTLQPPAPSPEFQAITDLANRQAQAFERERQGLMQALQTGQTAALAESREWRESLAATQQQMLAVSTQQAQAHEAERQQWMQALQQGQADTRSFQDTLVRQIGEAQRLQQEANQHFATSVDQVLAMVDHTMGLALQDTGSTQMVAQWMQDMTGQLDDLEARVVGQVQQQMQGNDPALQASIGVVRDWLTEQQKLLLEDMAARGIAQSGVSIETGLQLQKTAASQIGQMTAQRLSQLQQQIMDSVMNFAGQRIAIQRDGFQAAMTLEDARQNRLMQAAQVGISAVTGVAGMQQQAGQFQAGLGFQGVSEALGRAQTDRLTGAQLGAQQALASQGQVFQAGQAGLDRAQAAALAGSAMQSQQAQFLAGLGAQQVQAGLERTQQESQFQRTQAAQASQAALDRAQQRFLQASGQEFQASQTSLDRVQAESFFGRELGFKYSEGALGRAQELAVQARDQTFRGVEGAAARALQTTLQSSDQGFKDRMATLDRALSKDLQRTEVAAKSSESALDRAHGLTVLEYQKEFTKAQNALDRALQTTMQASSFTEAARARQSQEQMQLTGIKATNELTKWVETHKTAAQTNRDEFAAGLQKEILRISQTYEFNAAATQRMFQITMAGVTAGNNLAYLEKSSAADIARDKAKFGNEMALLEKQAETAGVTHEVNFGLSMMSNDWAPRLARGGSTGMTFADAKLLIEKMQVTPETKAALRRTLQFWEDGHLPTPKSSSVDVEVSPTPTPSGGAGGRLGTFTLPLGGTGGRMGTFASPGFSLPSPAPQRPQVVPGLKPEFPGIR